MRLTRQQTGLKSSGDLRNPDCGLHSPHRQVHRNSPLPDSAPGGSSDIESLSLGVVLETGDRYVIAAGAGNVFGGDEEVGKWYGAPAFLAILT